MPKMPPILGLLLAGLIYSLSWIMAPQALHELGEGLFMLTTLMVGYLSLSVILRKKIKTITFREVGHGITLGILLCLIMLGVIKELAGTPPLYLAGYPAYALLLVLPAQWLIKRQAPCILEFMASLLCAAGAFMLGIQPGPFGMGVIALMGLYLSLSAYWARDDSPSLSTTIELGAATLSALILAGKDLPANVDPRAWLLVIILGVATFAFSGILLKNSLQKFSPLKCAVILSLQLPIAAFLVSPADIYTPGMFSILAGGIILLMPRSSVKSNPDIA